MRNSNLMRLLLILAFLSVTSLISAQTTTYGNPDMRNDAGAFGRTMVALPVARFDSQLQYNLAPFLWESTLTTGGAITHLPNESSASLAVTSTTGSKAVNQTRKYIRYQPGRGQTIFMTGVMGAIKSGVRQRVGYFDGQNGLFFEQNGTSLRVVVRSNASGVTFDSPVNQSAWNFDKFNGTGPTGITLDMSKEQIFAIDLQWLGAGRVRFGFVVDGNLHFAHQFNGANSLTTVYMTTANLPLRYEIETTGSPGSGTTMTQTCSSVSSEGGVLDELGYQFTANNGTTAISVTTRRAVLSIQPKLTFNSITNRGEIDIKEFSVMVGGNNALIEVVYNGTLGGTPSFASVDTNSLVNFDVAGTTVTGGTVLYSEYIPAGAGATRLASTAGLLSKVPFALSSSGLVQDTISIVATSFTGTATVTAALNWTEVY